MTADPQIRTVTVQPHEARSRLDKVLAAALPELSRSRLKVLIESGQVSRDGLIVKSVAARVRPGEAYVVVIPPPAWNVKAEAEPIPLDIVFEDDDLIVIDKPAGLVVHPAVGNWQGTLVNALLAHCGDSLRNIGGTGRPGIVHRLDKDTSGLLVAAKTERAMRSLSKQFAARAVRRLYTALVWGSPRLNSFTAEGDIGRSPRDRKKMAVLKTGGRAALTHVRVLKRFRIASLVECKLETGRTHQIRVHLAHKGYSLVGDKVYGAPRKPPRAKLPHEARAFAALSAFPRQALHAGKLGFHHPRTDEELDFERPPPADFLALLAALKPLST